MPRSTDLGKLALWRERFSRFSGGKLAVGPFCARERVSVASFYYWREKVGKVGCARDDAGKKVGESGRVRRSPTDRRSVFQPVTVVPASPAIRIELPCGARIEVGTEDPEVVRAVVGVVVRLGAGLHGGDETC